MPEASATAAIEVRILGLDCAEEARALRASLEQAGDGALRFGIDILGGRLRVENPELLSDDALRAAVESAGLRIGEEAGAEAPNGLRALGTSILAALAAIAAFSVHAAESGLSGALSGGTLPPPAAGALYLVAVLIGMRLALPRAWAAARRLRPDMNFLMVVAVAGALGVGEWVEAAAVSVLFAFSLELEKRSVGRADAAVRDLLQGVPERVRIPCSSGKPHFKDAAAVAIGERFLVLPGELIPLDGVVVEGKSEINQAPITGEALPAAKGVGDPVFAGTLNGEGGLTLEATRRSADSTLARISRQVTQAREKRSPTERWVDRFAARYTPVVVGLAILGATIPPLFFGADAATWFYRSLVLLVIACPCALVISTPVSVVCALAAAARRGVLVKGGDALETAARIRAMAFDKTGTLTSGEVRVDRVIPEDEHSKEDLLRVGASLATRSEHPLAQAILESARAQSIDLLPVSEVETLRGRGLSGRVDGGSYWLGSHRYLEEREQETPRVHELLESLAAEGCSVVVIGRDDHVCGFITLRDRPDPHAPDALEGLRALGLRDLALLTGDSLGSARAIAEPLRIEHVASDLLPEDKVREVEAFAAEAGRLAMVGDGVNDAPALARADLGIAVGAAASDVAIETADVALLSRDLRLLPWLIRLARRTVGIIRQNVIFALGTKGIVLALAAFGQATLWMAILADMGASLVVIANAMRPLRSAPKK